MGYIKKSFMEDIKNELLELNFNVDSIGIVYWIDAIRFAKNHPLVWDMMDIYEHVAKKHNTTSSKVERGMRTAIKTAKDKIQEKYKYYNKIYNSTYLNLIKYKLI